MDSARVEEIVDRNDAGQGVVDSLLCLQGDDRSAPGHSLCPFYGVDPDIAAAVHRHDAIAVILAAHVRQRKNKVDLGSVEGGGLQELISTYPLLGATIR